MAAPTDVKQPGTSGTSGWRDLAHRQIEQRAYQIYLERGGEHGGDIEDWFQAETELRREAREQSEEQ